MPVRVGAAAYGPPPVLLWDSNSYMGARPDGACCKGGETGSGKGRGRPKVRQVRNGTLVMPNTGHVHDVSIQNTLRWYLLPSPVPSTGVPEAWDTAPALVEPQAWENWDCIPG